MVLQDATATGDLDGSCRVCLGKGRFSMCVCVKGESMFGEARALH